MRRIGILMSLTALTALLSSTAFTWGYWRFPRFWHLPSGRNPMPGDDRTARRDDSSHTYPHVSNVELHEQADDEAIGGGWILLGILAVIAAVVILAVVL